jgi:large conductance mechanosensitive channel
MSVLDQSNRARLAVIAVGCALGIAAYEVINSLVRGLLAPLIAVFIGESRFEMNALVIEMSEFQYGVFLEAVMVAVVVALVAFLVFRKYP